MSATSREAAGRKAAGRDGAPSNDPRVVRSRASVVQAARELFLRHGYGGTTMDDIAARAGLAKRTLYNNYAGKEALFVQIATEVIAYAEAFADDLRERLTDGTTAANLPARLDGLGQRLALAIVRPEIIALRRLLIGEAREFPALGRKYYEHAPGRVLDALASGFGRLGRTGLLNVRDARRAAAQFAYLVAGEPLDRAVLLGTVPPRKHIVACARDGVETFMARYQRAPGGRAGTGR